MKIPLSQDLTLGLKEIIDLQESDVANIAAALSDIRPTLYPQVLSSKIAPQVPGVNQENLNTIIETLYLLHSIKTSLDRTGGESDDKTESASFIASLSKALVSQDRGEQWDSPEENKLQQNLEPLLGNETIFLSSKALNLTSERENVFRDVQTIVDIRPIFGDEVDSGLQGVCLIRRLVIGFWGESGEEEVSLVIDENDIELLTSVLERLKSKVEKLRETIDTVQAKEVK